MHYAKGVMNVSDAILNTYNPNQPRDPKGSETGGRWVSSQEEMGKLEFRIASQDYETAGCYSQDGTLLFEKDGTKNSVLFSDAEVAEMKGAVVTHNHPSNSTFSMDDYELFHTSKAKEIRAVSEDYLYTLTAPDGYDYLINGQDLSLKLRIAQIKVEKSGINILDWKEYNHLTTEKWAEAVGLTYERIPR